MGERNKEDISSGWNDLSKSKVTDEFSGGMMVAEALGDRIVRKTTFWGQYFFRVGWNPLLGSKISFSGLWLAFK